MADYYKIMHVTLENIAMAIRKKLGISSAMTPDQMAAAIYDIKVADDTSPEPISGMEGGTVNMNAANYYGFTIPITSAKTHLVVWPESITNSMSTDYTQRFVMLFAVAGDGHLHAALDNAAGNSQRGGTIIWWNTDASNAGKVVFGTDNIEVTIDGGVWRAGAYKWCAW